MTNQSNKFTVEDAFDAIIEHKRKNIEKNNEIAERIMMAKTWVGMGMDPTQVAIILGQGAASLANVFGTMSFSSFKNIKSFKFESNINKIEEYAQRLTLNVNDLFKKNSKNIQLDTTTKFLSSSDLKLIRTELDSIEEDDLDEELELKSKLEDLTAQTAALAVVDYIKDLNAIAKSNKTEINFDGFEMSGYKSLVEISKFKNGDNIIQAALDSSAVKKEFKNDKIGAFASVYANLIPSLKPDIASQYVSESERKKKKEKKNKINTPL